MWPDQTPSAESVVEMTPQTDRSPILIEHLAPPNADRSTGLILHWRNYLLFALEERRNWRDTDNAQIARLIGIGGHLEPGESWAQAVQREALEEAGLRVTLVEPQRTLLLRDDSPPQDITGRLVCPPPCPLFIWSAIFRFGRPPHERAPHFLNPVFLAHADADDEPHPGMEVPGILALTQKQLIQATAHPPTLQALLDDGAHLWSAQPISLNTLIEPSGSARWYVTYLHALI